jgi:hypothetical protein
MIDPKLSLAADEEPDPAFQFIHAELARLAKIG